MLLRGQSREEGDSTNPESNRLAQASCDKVKVLVQVNNCGKGGERVES